MAWKTDFTQAPFHSSAVYGSDQGPRFYVREVLGIAEAVCAILIFLSIYSARRGDQWIGAFGDWAAVNLTFAVGNAIVFALPAMLGINAIFAMVGRRGKWSELRAVARGIGGILLIAAGCG
ncbi:hypothetical protein HYR69_01575, partial [Candidatus Sumerlaeota bacterium]|nr:hypothetical protein [Candidatus Sumerlaeota bacterium]